MEEILGVRNLVKNFEGFSLKNVNFTLKKGYIMGLIGPNGAGKSTTIKLIMNLMRRDAGEIKIFGMDNIKDEQKIKNRIGFVYDENYFYEELTVRETGKIIAPFYDKWDSRVFERFIKDFDLPPNKKIKELSKGMKMKFSLAVAFSHDAELLIMDEPTSGLDPIVRNELLEMLSNFLQDENKAVLFSTHITSDLEKIADYITFINRGETIFSMNKDDLLSQHAIIKGGRELLSESMKKRFIGLRENEFGFEGLTQDTELINSQKVKTVVEKPTLDDIMLYYVRGMKN